MPCHTRMKIILLKGILWLYLWGFSFMVASLEPGFLDFDNLPDTNFSCVGKVIGGYYADLETSCQMFHVCTIGQLDEPMDIRFLCLNGTVFDQETRVCERIDEVDCSKSEQFYSLNLELYGNTQPPILEDNAETDPPDILKHPASTSTTTTTTKRPTKPKTTRPSFIITTTPKSPPSSTTLEEKFLQSHHFPGSNSADIRFNPEEINISLNPGAPPNIRQKPVSFQQSISDNNKRVIVTTHTTVYKNDNNNNKPPAISTMSPQIVETQKPKTIVNYDLNHDHPSGDDNYNYNNAYHTEKNLDYETEIPHHEISFRPSFRPSSRDIEQHYSPKPEYKPSTYRTQYHPTTISPVRIGYSQRGPTTYRNSYSSPLKPALPYYHRTDKPPRIQLPLPLIPTLSPLTFSSPAPFSLSRHIESKRFTDHHQPPRIVISASASVSDASGRKFNYSLGTIGDSRFFGQAPHSYDDYKEDDVGLDPFYHDVPKLKRSHYRRQKRSVEEEKVKTLNQGNVVKIRNVRKNTSSRKVVKDQQNPREKNDNSNSTQRYKKRKLEESTRRPENKSRSSRRRNSKSLLEKELENNFEEGIERSSTENKRTKRKPEEDIKSEKEAIEVLKFLFNWYNSHEKVSEPSIPIKPETITEINKELTSNLESEYYYEDYDFTTKFEIQRSTPKTNENHKYETIDRIGRVDPNFDSLVTNYHNSKALQEEQLQIIKPPHPEVQFNVSEGVVSVTGESLKYNDDVKNPLQAQEVDKVSDVEYEYVDDNYEAQTYNHTITEKPVEYVENDYQTNKNKKDSGMISETVEDFKEYEVKSISNSNSKVELESVNNEHSKIEPENVRNEHSNEESANLKNENSQEESENVKNVNPEKEFENLRTEHFEVESENTRTDNSNVESENLKNKLSKSESENMGNEKNNTESEKLRNSKAIFENPIIVNPEAELENVRNVNSQAELENVRNINSKIEFEKGKNINLEIELENVKSEHFETESDNVRNVNSYANFANMRKSDLDTVNDANYAIKSRRRNNYKTNNKQEHQANNDYQSRLRNSNRRRNNSNQKQNGEAKSRRRNHNRQYVSTASTINYQNNDSVFEHESNTRSSDNDQDAKDFNRRNDNTDVNFDHQNNQESTTMNNDYQNSDIELTTLNYYGKVTEEQTNDNRHEFTITENYTPTTEEIETVEDSSKYEKVLKILGITTNNPAENTPSGEDSIPILTTEVTTASYEQTSEADYTTDQDIETTTYENLWTITQKGITELAQTETTIEDLATTTTARKYGRNSRRHYNQSKLGKAKKYMKSDELKKLEQYGSTITTENYFSTTPTTSDFQDITTKLLEFNENDYGIYSKEYKQEEDGSVRNTETTPQSIPTEVAVFTTVQLQDFIEKVESNTNSIADTRNMTDTTIEITTVDVPTTESQITTVESTTPFATTTKLYENRNSNTNRRNRFRGGHRFSVTTSEKPERRKPSITEEIVDVIKNRMDSDAEQSTRKSSRRKKIQDFNINAYTANLAYRNRKSETTEEIPITEQIDSNSNLDERVTSPSFSKSANPTVAKNPKDLLPTTPLSKSRNNLNFAFNCFGKVVNKFYSDPRDCRLFHYCTKGFTKTQLLDMKFVCDLGTYFDSEKLICTKDKPVRCT